MKKLYMTFLAAAAALGASALTVSQPVKIMTDGPAHNPVLSPDGKAMLYSSDNHTGLKLLTFATSETVTLDESAGAGFNPIFSADGSRIIYQTAEVVEGLLSRDVRAFDLASGISTRLSEMSRGDINLNAAVGHTDYVVADIKGINVTRNGQTEMIRPIADAHSYIWASLSPDGNRIVFVEPFKGVFVTNLDGTETVRIAAKGDFPAWAGNNLVTFTESHDDGYVILDSTLRICDLTTGLTVNLTPADVKVGESSSSANGTVVYSTLAGDIYMINVE